MEEPSVIPDYVGWLEELGMEPHRVPAYATHRVTAGLEPELQMLRDGKLDLIAFSSVGEIDGLLHMLGDDRDVLAGADTRLLRARNCERGQAARSARRHRRGKLFGFRRLYRGAGKLLPRLIFRDRRR